MKRKWRKRRMMTPRRMRKRRFRQITYDYWQKVMEERLKHLWLSVPTTMAELEMMGFGNAFYGKSVVDQLLEDVETIRRGTDEARSP